MLYLSSQYFMSAIFVPWGYVIILLSTWSSFSFSLRIYYLWQCNFMIIAYKADLFFWYEFICYIINKFIKVRIFHFLINFLLSITPCFCCSSCKFWNFLILLSSFMKPNTFLFFLFGNGIFGLFSSYFDVSIHFAI